MTSTSALYLLAGSSFAFDTVCKVRSIDCEVIVATLVWLHTTQLSSTTNMHTDHLSPLERNAVNAVKRQRCALPAGGPQATEHLLSNLRSYSADEIALRRNVEHVLERELQLLQARLLNATEEVQETHLQCLELQLRRDRLAELTNEIFPAKMASIEALRQRIAEVEESSIAQQREKTSISMSNAMHGLLLHSTEVGRRMIAGETISTTAWLTAEDVAPDVRTMVESSLLGDETSSATVTDASPSTESSHAMALHRRRAEVRTCIARCADASLAQHVPTWYRIASETACLRKKLNVDKIEFPKYEAMEAEMNRAQASRAAIDDEQQRQLALARQRLEEAHRSIFNTRKHMITLHRKMTETGQRFSGANGKELLETIRNELAMGKLDRLRALCNEEAVASANGTSASLREYEGTTQYDERTSVGRGISGGVAPSVVVRPSSAAASTSKQHHLEPVGTFIPDW